MISRSPARGACACAVFWLAGCIAPAPRTENGGAPRQDARRPLEPEPLEQEAEIGVDIAPVSTPPLPGEELEQEVIDLPTALRLAGARNIDVQAVAQRIEAASASVDEASAVFLPELAVGAGYLRHDGRFQETRGEVFDVSRSSLGAGPVLKLRFDPAEAHFERLRAKQVLDAFRHSSEKTRTETVVRSAVLYLELVRARAQLEVAREALRQSTAHRELSERMVELRAELRVHLARARAEEARDQERLLRAEHDLRRASVDLAVWLRLPPATLLVPADERLQPLMLVDPEAPAADLIARALAARPDLEELEALERAAEERLEGARWSPWVPAVDVFAGYGAFGGGRGSFFGDFDDRGDYGAALVWRLEGLGFGDRARYRRARAELGEARLRVEGLEETIAGEVIRTREEARSLRARISAARARAEAARETLELATARFQAGDAIQLEVLEAAREAAESRAELVDAIVEFNELQHVFLYRVEGRSWGEGEE